MHLAVKLSATFVALGTCVGAFILWYVRKHKGSDFVRVIISRGTVLEKRDSKLGLTFRYSPTDATLIREVRCFPVAVFELHIIGEEGSQILITIEECGNDITLEEYKICSLKDVMSQLVDVHLLREKPTTLAGHSAVEFEYTHKEARGVRQVWCVATVVKRRAYCVTYNSSAERFKCSRIALDMCKSLQILPPRPSDSFLFFTEPRYGVGMRLPITYHVDGTSTDSGVIARFLALHDTTRGGDMLDKSFMELKVLRNVEVRPTIEATLEVVTATLKRSIEAEGVGESEVLQWKSGCVSEAQKGFLRRTTSNYYQVHNVVLKKTSLPGRYFFYDISCPNVTDGSPVMIQYIVMFCVYASDAYILTAWSEEEHFSDVVASTKECFHSLCFGNQYGQEDSLLYCNPTHRFSVRVPTHFQVHEPPIGDPLVLFTPANSTTVEDITSTWITVESTDTDSTPTMSSVPVVVEAQCANPFSVQIHVQDVPNHAKLADVASEFVADMREMQRVEIEEERNGAVDGVSAREIVYTQTREDHSMTKSW